MPTVFILFGYIFKFYSDLMLAYYSPVKTEQGIADWLGQTTWQVRKNILPAMRLYTATKVFNIIGEIRRTDGASKGVGGQKTSDGDLLKELVYQILH
jgi:DNA polymerase-3 subunit delta